MAFKFLTELKEKGTELFGKAKEGLDVVKETVGDIFKKEESQKALTETMTSTPAYIETKPKEVGGFSFTDAVAKYSINPVIKTIAKTLPEKEKQIVDSVANVMGTALKSSGVDIAKSIVTIPKVLLEPDYQKREEGLISSILPKDTGNVRLNNIISEYKTKEESSIVKNIQNLYDEYVVKPIIGKSEEAYQSLSDVQKNIVQPIFDEKPGLNNWKEYLFTTTSGALSMAEAVGIMAITKNPSIAAGFLSAVESTEIYREALNAGKSQTSARKIAMISGIGIYYLEKLGLNLFLKKLPGSFIANALIKGTGETAQELTQTAYQNLIKKVGYDESQKVLEGIWETFVGAAPISFIAGGFSEVMISNTVKEVMNQTGLSKVEARNLVEQANQDIQKQIESIEKGFRNPIPVGLTIEPIKEPSTIVPEAQKGGKVALEVENGTLAQEARKYKSAVEFVKAQPTYYHTTDKVSADLIEKEGFKPQIGERSLGVANAKGTWLYEDISPTNEFGKNFTRVGKEPAVIETKVNGKIFDATNDERSIRGVVEDKKLIAKLKSEGYVGVKGDELGTSATFIFDNNAIKTKSQLTDIWNKAQQLTPKLTEKPTKIQKEIEKTVGIKKEPSKMIERREESLLKARIKSEARGALTSKKVEQVVAKRQLSVAKRQESRRLNQERLKLKTELITKFNQEKMTSEQAKKEVQDVIVAVLEPKDRGKFLGALRSVKTTEQAIKVFIRIDNFANKQELNQAIIELKESVKKISESKSVSVDYRNKIKDIVSQYELTGHSKATIDKLNNTQKYLDKLKSEGNDIELPQNVLNKLRILSRTPKENLTLSQVMGLQNEIELIEKIGKTKWKTKQALYNYEKETRKNILLEEATPINSKELEKVEIGSKENEWVKKYIGIRNYLQKSNIGLTPIDGLADITGMTRLKEDLDLDFGNYLTYNDESINKWYELTKNFNDSNFKRIGAIAISKQKGGIERLANSGITEEELSKIDLTRDEEKAYEFVRESFEKEFPSVKKYIADVYNSDVGQVDNYVSFLSDYDSMSDLEIYERFGNRPEQLIGKTTKTTEKGFTEKRAKVSKIKLELNIDNIFRRHLDDVAYMITMGKDIKQYYEIINSSEMREKLGDIGTLSWLQYLDLMARKGGTEGGKRIAALDVVRKNMGAGILAFRFSSALVQFSSFSDTIATIGSKYATKGAVNISTSKDWRNFIMDNFPEVKKAVGDDIAFREFGEGFFDKLSRAGFKPLQVLDGVMRATAASGAYQKLAEEKGIKIDLLNPDKNLIQEATRLMRQSQGSSFFKDQPLALTTGYGITDNKSLNKTILTFQSFMLNRWDNIKRQIWRMGIKEKDYKKAISSFFWLIIFSAAMEEGIRRGTRSLINLVSGNDNEEKSFINNAIGNIIQNVPILGQLVSSITYSSNPVPVINTIDDVISGIGSTIKGKAISTKLRGATTFMGGIGSLVGLAGSSQASQIVKKFIKDKKENSSNLPALPKLPKLPELPKLPKLPKL